MNVQVDGQDIDVRVLRLGPNDRLAVNVELMNQKQFELLHRALVHWSGLPKERVIILRSGVQLSVLSPPEPPESGNGSEVAPR